ncbi:adventurous gliding motility lipoprotein CglD [Myxococcaceae bacterium GXIMD 01537]
MSKSLFLRWSAATLLSVALLTGCPGGNDPEPIDPPGVDGGQDGGDDGGTNNTDDGGTIDPTKEDPVITPDPVPDPGPVPTDQNNPNNATLDSDCDGLTDDEEFTSVYGVEKLKTDPSKRDTDGDGIRDGVEVGRTSTVNTNCTFFPDADPSSRTSPVNADTDGDGIPDGLEDVNRNGKREPNETDPSTSDSDGDGLADGVEDKNRNGVVSPGETDPRKRDTDGDGISDGTEVNVTKTDPLKPDTDGDGCTDGAEDKNFNGVKDSGESDPKVAGDCGSQDPDTDGDGISDAIETATGTDKLKADTDGDGLADGVEDKNRNGRVDTGETNPRTKDSDCDGLQDGPTQGSYKGEDLNGNGQREAAETDPTNPDTDGDGLLDGVERGVGVALAPVTNCGYKGDEDPASTTDPLKADSDGDGISDGAEDNNQNGRVDSGELNPNNAADGASGTPAGQACSVQNLRQVSFKEDNGADIRLALRPSFLSADIVPLETAGKTVGFVGYDSTKKVTFIAYKRGKVNSSTTAAADESGIRAASFNSVGLDYTQTFTTWDSYPAMAARYTRASSSEDLKTFTNTLARSLVPNSTGSLLSTAGVTGEFKMQAQYVHRSDSSVVVVIAITASANYNEAGGLFTMADTAGGTALAQFGDVDAVQCETFTARTSAVDFLFVVDDSCSMSVSQTALSDTATAMANKLGNSSLDWRMGMVTTSYTSGNNSSLPNTNINKGIFRSFTNNIHQFRAWLKQNSDCSSGRCSGFDAATEPTTCTDNRQCWVRLSGDGAERPLDGARAAINHMTDAAAPAANKLRPGAKLVVVLMTDTKDQSADTNINTYINFFNTTAGNPASQRVAVHGIICPQNTTCGSNEDPNDNTRLKEVIEATGGVTGYINSPTTIVTTINAIVDSVIASSGYKTLKPPIGASMKVAMSDVLTPASCDKNDVPRSRTNGFDVDGINQTVSLFGACRPASSGTTQAAVSYRYWVDRSTNANGSPLPCASEGPLHNPSDPDYCLGKLVCNRATDKCECPADCGGGGKPEEVCNTDPKECKWECGPDCNGACGSFKTCNTGTCSCSCVQSASCAPGFKFDPNACGCVCDAQALGCGSTYNVDLNTCSCVCKPDCGGCGVGYTCNKSYCMCQGGIN